MQFLDPCLHSIVDEFCWLTPGKVNSSRRKEQSRACSGSKALASRAQLQATVPNIWFVETFLLLNLSLKISKWSLFCARSVSLSQHVYIHAFVQIMAHATQIKVGNFKKSTIAFAKTRVAQKSAKGAKTDTFSRKFRFHSSWVDLRRSVDKHASARGQRNVGVFQLAYKHFS